MLRLMGRHRNSFSKSIRNDISEEGSIQWFDHSYTSIEKGYDYPFEGIHFLKKILPFEQYNLLWKEYNASFTKQDYMPQWDAVGKTGNENIVLLSAYTNLLDLNEKQISNNILINEDYSWMQDYPQYAAKYFTLRFLDENNIAVKMVNVYFVNELANNENTPPNDTEWEKAINGRDMKTGLIENTFYKEHVFSRYISIDNDVSYILNDAILVGIELSS